MRLAMLLFIFLTYIMGDTFNNVSNRPSCQKYNRINRYDYLTKLIRTSNFPFARWEIEASEIKLMIDEHNNNLITAMMYIDNNEQKNNQTAISTIAWLQYNIETGELFDITIDENRPQRLNYDKSWFSIVKRLFSDSKQRFILFDTKTFLYSKPQKSSKSEKFLIKGDCALNIDKKDSWYKIYFYHEKWKKDTIMWVRFFGMNLL
jgi:hypothetical protein